MTDSFFFDSDCISAFLWVNEQNLLPLLYPGRIIIPKATYDELSYPGIPHLKQRMDTMIETNQAVLESIVVHTDTYDLYCQLTSKKGIAKVIGSGEAAAIALAKTRGGVVASNNLKDIDIYVKEFKLQHITTGGILMEALEKDLITLQQGENIWALMLSKRRKLGAPSFIEYINASKKND